MTASSLTIVPAFLLALCACRAEPEINCERVRFGWPHFELDPSADVGDDEGIQIDFSVRSDLMPNASAKLSVALTGPEGDEDPVLAAETKSDQDGLLSFTQVTVPLGPIIFTIDAEDECGKARSGRRVFVWDGLGQPQCDLKLATQPSADATGKFYLQADHDEDDSTPGMQVSVVIEAGRPDMEVTLFVVDRETEAQQALDVAVDATGVGVQPLTLAEGEQAMRAVCYWEYQDFLVNSPTRVYFVPAP